MNIQVYSEEFKQAAVQKLLSPESLGLSATARKIGIANSTLFGWKQKYSKSDSMKKNKNIKQWNSEQKLEAIIKTALMTENELGEYLRMNGLHTDDLNRFKEEALAGFSSKGRPQLDPEVVNLRKNNKTLEKEIKRKDKALAELSARVILLKKSQEIWGDSEDDE